MNYLHKSEVKVHGNLKSKNCVVNSRWTVKLQDFSVDNDVTLPKNDPHFENAVIDYSGLM